MTSTLVISMLVIIIIFYLLVKIIRTLNENNYNSYMPLRTKGIHHNTSSDKTILIEKVVHT